MLAQAVVFVAFLTTLALGVLSSNLLSARLADEQRLASYASLAEGDAVDGVTAAVRAYVEEHGTQGAASALASAPEPQALCPSRDGPAACPYTYTAVARITGSSNAPQDASTEAQTNDEALNLQTFLIDEARVSVTVVVTISDAGGPLETSTRFLTLRVFDAPPYAMVSGQRDLTAGNAGLEGDNGGAAAADGAAAVPNGADPEAYHDTEIDATLPCRSVDSIANADSNHPSHNQGRGNRQLPWGVGGAGGFELPCTSAFATPPPGAFVNKNWSNGNAALAP